MSVPASDWTPEGPRYRRLIVRAAILGGGLLPPSGLMILLGLYGNSVDFPTRMRVILVGGQVTLGAALLLLTARWLQLPAVAIEVVTWGAMCGLVVSGAPVFGAGFLTCVLVFHAVAMALAIWLLAERRSTW